MPLICLVAALAGCAAVDPAAAPSGAAEGIRLWYLAPTGGSALGWEVLPGGDVPAGAEDLAARLLAGPQGGKLSSPFPAGVTVLSCLPEPGDNVLHVDLSEAYGALSGIELTAADACLTLTLCQLEGVEGVYTTVEGASPAGRARQILRPDDLILSGAGEEPVYVMAVLYFPRLEGRGLGVEHRAVLVPEGVGVTRAIAEALLAGPERDALLWIPMPAGTRLLEISVTERICLVNLSAEFRDGLPNRQEDAHLLIYSLVDTLGNLENVDAVQLLVEGEPLDDSAGIPLSRPLEPDFRLIEE